MYIFLIKSLYTIKKYSKTKDLSNFTINKYISVLIINYADLNIYLHNVFKEYLHQVLSAECHDLFFLYFLIKIKPCISRQKKKPACLRKTLVK